MEQIENLKELINQGDVDTAIKQLNQLLLDTSVENEKDILYYLRGNAYRKKGDWKRALDNYQFTNTLFLFCGRRRDRIKGLYWEKDGFILLYKRLEQGAYQWPRSESEVKTLTPQQYRWLMEGLQIEQPKAHRPVTGLAAV